MEWRPVFFALLQAGVCLYALMRGALPERWIAALMAVAALATFAVPVEPHVSYHSLEVPVFWIDLAFLASLFAVAARANRFWPMWLTALQLLAIGVHGVSAVDAAIIPNVYARAVAWLAYPMIMILAVGTYRHGKRTKDRKEDNWSPLRWW